MPNQKTLYLDVCAYCRPFDNQQSLRIRLETDALYLILKHVERGNYCVAVSPVHFQEISAINKPKQRSKLESLLKRLQTPFEYQLQQARAHAEQLYTQGFGIADAAHIAFAEQVANIFISCDDKLLKKCRKAKLNIMAVNPVEFITSENLQ